jgi:hypothetical protein
MTFSKDLPYLVTTSCVLLCFLSTSTGECAQQFLCEVSWNVGKNLGYYKPLCTWKWWHCQRAKRLYIDGYTQLILNKLFLDKLCKYWRYDVPYLNVEYFLTIPPVRIRVRIGPPHPLLCRKRRLNGVVLRMRPKKPRPIVTADVAR